jgi:hypothetical protein
MAYSKEQIETIFQTILNEIESGRALRNILDQKDMPCSITFYKWLDEDEEKTAQYARATKIRAERIFEDILLIADDQEEDVIKLEDGREIVNHNKIGRAKLRVDARKWVLSKMDPKKYGDKVDVTSKGEEIKGNIINLGGGTEPEEK